MRIRHALSLQVSRSVTIRLATGARVTYTAAVSDPSRTRKLSKPAAYTLIAVIGLVVLMGDDISALMDRVMQAPWMFSAPDQRPTGTWRGEFMGRTITLALELDTLSDEDSLHRTNDRNGFFYRRLELARGVRTVQGTLTVTAPDGKTDRFETEGSPNMRGTFAALNVHGANGVAGIMIEKADVTFAPPHAEARLRYRLPGTPKSGGYITAGVLWSAAPEPGVMRLERMGL
jgi:hypothetical protein